MAAIFEDPPDKTRWVPPTRSWIPVCLTGRLFDNDGKSLWVGKGFTSSLEPGIKGATLEQYEASPKVLRKDFEAAVQAAAKRLAGQANAVPKASVKVAVAD